MVVVLWVRDYVTGSEADWQSSSFYSSFAFAVFMCFCFFLSLSLMIYRLQERNRGSEERQRDIKRKRESGREEGWRELRELIILFNHILDGGQVVCGTESETERGE